MGFDLVDRRNYLVVNDYIHQSIGLEVANTDGSNLAFSIQFFHCSPRAIDIAVGLMNQIKIQIIQLQSFERSFKGLLCAFAASILNPKLGSDKYLLPCHTTFLNGCANSFFVLISRSGINQAIARTDGFIYASFTLFGVSDLINTEP